MHHLKAIRLALFGAFCLLAVNASAAPVYFSANGHWYDYVAIPDYGWLNAANAAASTTFNGMQGQLATITSAGENAFISNIYHGNAYLGGTDLSGTWEWVTGESFVYTNWGPGEPNNFINTSLYPWGENFLMIWHSDGFPSNFATDAPDQWNDIFNYNQSAAIANNSDGYINGYFVEFAPTIPEPETYAMILAGLGVIGFSARRRKPRS
jgi:hypothetical protein